MYGRRGTLAFHLTGPLRSDRDDLIWLGENCLEFIPRKRRIQGSHSRLKLPSSGVGIVIIPGQIIRVAGYPARQLSLAACT